MSLLLMAQRRKIRRIAPERDQKATKKNRRRPEEDQKTNQKKNQKKKNR